MASEQQAVVADKLLPEAHERIGMTTRAFRCAAMHSADTGSVPQNPFSVSHACQT